MRNIINKFKLFLIQENLYTQFVENLKTNTNESFKEYCKYIKPESFITSAFHWFNVPEDKKVWSIASDFWIKIYLKS